MFWYNHHHQGAHCLSLLNLQLLKQSIKICWCGLSGGVAAYVIKSLKELQVLQGLDNICSHTTR